MKPCSVVIEVYPWHYRPIGFYRTLANRVGLVHIALSATPESTVIGAQNARDHDQKAHYNFSKFFDMSLSEQQREHLIAQHCTGSCADLFRLVDGFYVNVTEVLEAVRDGMRQRPPCLARHPVLGPAMHAMPGPR